MKILIVGNNFPVINPKFIQFKLEGLAQKGHYLINLSSSPINHKLLRIWKSKNKNSQVICRSTVEYNFIKFFFLFLWQLIAKSKRTIKLLSILNQAGYSGLEFYISLKNNLILLHLSDLVEIIHFEWNNQATSFFGAYSLLEKPFIVSVRGRGITSQPLIDSNLAARLPLLFDKATLIHTLGKDLTKYISRYTSDLSKIRIISPAVNLSAVPVKTNYNNDIIRIVTVASFVWKKNLISALIVFRHLQLIFTNLEYWIIGDGPLKEALFFVCDELQLTDKVKFLGELPHHEVLDCLSKCDIFLMPSIQEGFCNAVVEAQAVGLPVVVTDADGLSENIAHGETGIVVSRWDCDEWFDTLQQLIKDSELRKLLGQNGVKRARKLYNFQEQLAKFELIYEEAIRSKRKE